jgi:uncharacterized membrane protein
MGEQAARGARPARNDSLDLLRGLVMVVMALDHARDFWTNQPGDPTLALATTTPAMFLTRWVTHFCAPVFVLLAGVGAYLGSRRGKSKAELARFLVTRGLWLLVVEVTLVRWGWLFQLGFHIVIIQVIWTLGACMIVLAGLIWLPTAVVGALGVALIVGHDALDGIHAADLGRASWLWTWLHERGALFPAGHVVNVIYPFLPWPGVMASGYALGAVFTRPEAERRRLLVRGGGALVLAFVVVRALNIYADPHVWTTQRSPLFTLFSFLACSKYPPSLDYLLMTLGPALVFLGLVDGRVPSWSRPFVTFGRVPFFFYVLHVPLLHAGAILAGAVVFGADGARAFVGKLFLPDAQSTRFGFSLPVVYLAWLLALVVLYPACRWFAGVKARSRSPWLSYL